MEYVKTFALLAVFLILAAGNIANIIRHREENKEARMQKKEAKRKAREERKKKQRFRFFYFGKKKR